jgi:hypothetical protein
MSTTPRDHAYIVRDDADLPPGEYLIRIEDGEVTLTYREKSWHAWSAPITADVLP